MEPNPQSSGGTEPLACVEGRDTRSCVPGLFICMTSGHPCCSGLYILLTEEERGAQSYTLLSEVTHLGKGLESRPKLGHMRARLWVSRTSLFSSRGTIYAPADVHSAVPES